MRIYRFLVIAFMIIWYSFAIGIFHNQPISFVHPFEYYQSEDLILMQWEYLWIMMTPLFLMLILFSSYIKTVISTKGLLALLFIGSLLMIWNRYSIVLYIGLCLLFIKYLSDKVVRRIVAILLPVIFFIIVIPLFILKFNHESFLDVDGFQNNIATYVEGEYFTRLQYNLEQIVPLIGILLFILVLCMVSASISVYWKNSKISQLSLLGSLIAGITFVLGTMMRSVMYVLNDHTLIWIGLIFGAFLQSLALSYFIVSIGRKFNNDAMQIKDLKAVALSFIAMITMIDIFAPIYYTKALTFGATTLHELMLKGVIFSVISYILFMIFVIFNKKVTYR